jgi:threonine/homoserine/homoserine lactone efflux protein
VPFVFETVWLFALGVGFGFAATVPPGPINTEIARRTLKFGWLPGLSFGLGSILIENGLALLSCMGYGIRLDHHPAFIPVLLFVGFMVLAIVGSVSLANGYRAWNAPSHATDPEDAALAELRASPGLARTQLASAPRSLLAGVGMTIISPYTIIFWIVGLPAVAHRALQEGQHVAPLLGGVLLGTSLWVWGFTSLLSWLKRYSTTWWIVWADLVGGVMLLVFAALALLKLVAELRSGRSIPLPF